MQSNYLRACLPNTSRMNQTLERNPTRVFALLFKHASLSDKWHELTKPKAGCLKSEKRMLYKQSLLLPTFIQLWLIFTSLSQRSMRAPPSWSAVWGSLLALLESHFICIAPIPLNIQLMPPLVPLSPHCHHPMIWYAICLLVSDMPLVLVTVRSPEESHNFNSIFS